MPLRNERAPLRLGALEACLPNGQGATCRSWMVRRDHTTDLESAADPGAFRSLRHCRRHFLPDQAIADQVKILVQTIGMKISISGHEHAVNFAKASESRMTTPPWSVEQQAARIAPARSLQGDHCVRRWRTCFQKGRGNASRPYFYENHYSLMAIKPFLVSNLIDVMVLPPR